MKCFSTNTSEVIFLNKSAACIAESVNAHAAAGISEIVEPVAIKIMKAHTTFADRNIMEDGQPILIGYIGELCMACFNREKK